MENHAFQMFLVFISSWNVLPFPHPFSSKGTEISEPFPLLALRGWKAYMVAFSLVGLHQIDDWNNLVLAIFKQRNIEIINSAFFFRPTYKIDVADQ